MRLPVLIRVAAARLPSKTQHALAGEGPHKDAPGWLRWAKPANGSSVTVFSGNRKIAGYMLVFFSTFVFLFLGMDRGFDFYDEGLNLVGAMRVAAGQVPHRDFYTNYGPAQFYMLSWLFHLFGPSVFVERLYDLALRSAIVATTWGIVATYCRPLFASISAIVCALWLLSIGLPTIAYSVIPSLLLVLLSSWLLLPFLYSDVKAWKIVPAGCLAGLIILFRYDIGVAVVAVHVLSMIAWQLQRKFGLRASLIRLGLYLLGVAVICLPPAVFYLSVAPLQALLHDTVYYPAKYYAHARRIPFPGLHWRSLENLALYLPVPVVLLCIYVVSANFRFSRSQKTANQANFDQQRTLGFLTLFALLDCVGYAKGFVRVSVLQTVIATVLTMMLLAVLLEYTERRIIYVHRVVQCLFILSTFASIWSALKEVRVLSLNHDSVLEELWSPPGPKVLDSETQWCSRPNPLHTGLCFLVDPSHAETIDYLVEKLKPNERFFIGLARHDRLMMNDLLTYFAVNHLPATHWAQFDPDLQTRADIQRQMIAELEQQQVRFVVLESQFDAVVERFNDSSKSSGVTLLDVYIRTHYHLVKARGSVSIWQRNGSAI